MAHQLVSFHFAGGIGAKHVEFHSVHVLLTLGLGGRAVLEPTCAVLEPISAVQEPTGADLEPQALF